MLKTSAEPCNIQRKSGRCDNTWHAHHRHRASWIHWMGVYIHISFLLLMSDIVHIKAVFYPKVRNNSSSKAVKQTVRSSDDGRRRGEWRGPPGAVSNHPPGSRDRSNISCSSVWPATTWGVTLIKRDWDEEYAGRRIWILRTSSKRWRWMNKEVTQIIVLGSKLITSHGNFAQIYLYLFIHYCHQFTT